MREAVFRSRRSSRVYRGPVCVLRAERIADMAPMLEEAARYAAAGYHAAGFIAYEAAAAFDPALSTHPPGNEAPLACFGIFQTYTEDASPRVAPGACEFGGWRALITEAEYMAAVRRIREYIAAGDTYQVNFSFPMEASFAGDPRACFDRLWNAQRADHCAYLDMGDRHILSLSPELFFHLEGPRLVTRPMKGTRPRGRWLEEDERIRAELAASGKDRAENVMIVDLLRNDMGRISETGSVCVESLYDIERYDTLFQMTSTISSRTEATPPEILRALFPSGSVTGAPKVRTMQIIRECEPYPRGVYCGAVGWWAPDGVAEFNVAIRTLTIEQARGVARYNVGSGITWDSHAGAEYEECRLKAAAVVKPRPAFALLETLLYDGDYVLLEEHLGRMASSAAYFGFTCDREKLREALTEEARAFTTPRRVRLLLERDGVCRIEHTAAPPPAECRIGFARAPVDETGVFLYHKTTHRRVYEEARASRPDCDDVILWNRRGEITESSVANIVVEIGGEKLTPPIACGLLGGVFRRRLIEEGALREAILRKEDIIRADRVWLINSVRRWIPCALVDAPVPSEV